MIFHEVKLHNFRALAGTQSINLQVNGAGRPVILVGALNGSGKTSLFEAIQLVLYGAEAPGKFRNQKDYKQFLADAINRGTSMVEGAWVELTFERAIEGELRIYTVRRSWRQTSKGIQETLRVLKDGDPDTVLADHWGEFMESFLPARIAQLFFFDGEQIEAMVEPEAMQATLASAFHNLLGLDLISQLDVDLNTLERRKRIDKRSTADRKRISLLEEEKEKGFKRVEQEKQRLAQINGQLSRAREVQRKAEEEFRSKGGNIFQEQDQLVKQRESVKQRLDEAQERIRKLAAGPAPFLMVEALLKETVQEVEAELGREEGRLVAEAEAERDKRILAQIKKQLDTKSLQSVKEALEQTRVMDAGNHEGEVVFAASREELSGLRHFLSRELPDARRDLEAALEEMQCQQAALDDLDRTLSQVPDVDAIAELQRTLRKAEADVRRLETERDEQEKIVEKAQFEANLKTSLYNKEVEAHAEDWEAGEHERRILERIPKVKETLSAFQQLVVKRHIGNLESEIRECFQHLMRKPEFIQRVEIDPDSYDVHIKDSEEREVPLGLLSAGERQLLATSILWALGKISGRPVPTIIDTPLGRLDSNHRTHLVERYFPAASHQVILLSTDEEIVGDYYTKLKPAIQRSYTIDYSPKTKTSVITEGYLEKVNEAAC